MNKIEFKSLNKEQMIIAFNQLKDDYHKLFGENEDLKAENKILKATIWKMSILPYEYNVRLSKSEEK